MKKFPLGGTADGVVQPEDHQMRHIVVQVLSAKDLKPILGSEVEAVVQLRNSDTKTIQIPWSTDSDVVKDGQKQDDVQWEGATFEFTLGDHEGSQVALKSLTQWLHGSKFAPGSLLTLQPGQSIRALVKFKLEELYPTEPLRLKEGEWQLSVEWHQVGRTWHVKNCAAWNGYFYYDQFYEQQNPPFAIQVTAEDSSKATKSR